MSDTLGDLSRFEGHPPEWSIHRNTRLGLVWIEGPNGESICDLYHADPRQGHVGEFVAKPDAEANAEMIVGLAAEVLRLREARDLAYGLLWTMTYDTRTANGRACHDARKALLATMSKVDQKRGIDLARNALKGQGSHSPPARYRPEKQGEGNSGSGGEMSEKITVLQGGTVRTFVAKTDPVLTRCMELERETSCLRSDLAAAVEALASASDAIEFAADVIQNSWEDGGSDLDCGTAQDMALDRRLIHWRKPTETELADPSWWGHEWEITADDSGVGELTDAFKEVRRRAREAIQKIKGS